MSNHSIFENNKAVSVFTFSLSSSSSSSYLQSLKEDNMCQQYQIWCRSGGVVDMHRKLKQHTYQQKFSHEVFNNNTN